MLSRDGLAFRQIFRQQGSLQGICVHPRFGVGIVWRESMAVVAEVSQRLLARRSAGPRPGLTVESVSWACEGGHKAGIYGEYVGLGGRGLAEIFRLGTCYEYRHQVGEACCRRGGVAGAEPPHKGGPNRPDRPEMQGLGAGGQGLVVRDGATPVSGLIADRTWLSCYPRYRKDHPNFGMHPRHCNWLADRRGECYNRAWPGATATA